MGDGGCDRKGLSGDGVSEFDAVGVEELTLYLILRVDFARAVERIAQDGTADVGEMDADLVRASGVGLNEDEAEELIMSKGLDRARGCTRVRSVDAHAFTLGGVTTNW